MSVEALPVVDMVNIPYRVRDTYHAALMEAFFASELRPHKDDREFENCVVSPAIYPEYAEDDDSIPEFNGGAYRTVPIDTYKAFLESGLATAVLEGFVEEDVALDVRRALGWVSVDATMPQDASVLPFIPRPRTDAEPDLDGKVIPITALRRQVS